MMESSHKIFLMRLFQPLVAYVLYDLACPISVHYCSVHYKSYFS